jgi:hypothetical protein
MCPGSSWPSAAKAAVEMIWDLAARLKAASFSKRSRIESQRYRLYCQDSVLDN